MAALPQVEEQFFRFKRSIPRDDRVENIRAFLGVLQVTALEEPPEHRAKRRERTQLRALRRLREMIFGGSHARDPMARALRYYSV